MNMPFFTAKDLILGAIYIALLFYLTNNWLKNRNQDATVGYYSFFALVARIISCILNLSYHQFYYKGGDVYQYIEAINNLNTLFIKDPYQFFLFIVTPVDNISQEMVKNLSLTGGNPGFWYESNALICRIGSLLSLICFNSFFCISLLMTFFSFLGTVKLFNSLKAIYPYFEKEIAIAVLFIPSVCFWGAGGIVKETLVTGALGFTLSTFFITINNYKKCILNKWILLKNAVLFSLGLFIIIIVRPFISFTLIPLLFLTYFIKIRYYFSSFKVKSSIFLGLILISSILIFLISNQTDKFNKEKIIKSAFKYYYGNKTEDDDNTNYSIGNIDPSVLGLLKSIPIATITSAFRPSIFDYNKPVFIPLILENSLLLGIFFRMFWRAYRNGVVHTISIIAKPEVFFSLFFSLTLLFISGFTASNFGNLVRYRVVALPFFVFVMLAIGKLQNKNLNTV